MQVRVVGLQRDVKDQHRLMVHPSLRDSSPHSPGRDITTIYCFSREIPSLSIACLIFLFLQPFKKVIVNKF